MTQPVPPSRRRRWIAAAVALPLLTAALAVAALPWALGTEPARRWMLERANRALAPNGGLRIAAFRFSWFGPTRLDGFAILGDQRQPLVTAPVAVWDRTLAQVLFDRPRYGRLTLAGATIAIERRADGTVDLAEALRPIIERAHPLTDLRIAVPGGTLRVRSPELARPWDARPIDLTIHRRPRPAPVSWRLALADGASGLVLQGDVDRAPAGSGRPSDWTVDVTGTDWPIDLATAALEARWRFDGTVRAARREGRWSVSGDARALGLDATGPALRGARVRLDRVGGTWDVAETATGLSVRALDLRSPVGSLRAEPGNAAPGRTRLVGDLDLAALARLAPGLLPEGDAIERGHARLTVDARSERLRPAVTSRPTVRTIADRPQGPAYSPPVPQPAGPPTELDLDARVDLPDLLWARGAEHLEVPSLALTVRARYRTDRPDAIAVADLLLTGPYGALRASGTLDDLDGRRLADLRGTFEPDWDAINRRLAEAVEPGATIEGETIAFRVRGPLGPGGDLPALMEGLDVAVRAELHAANIYGLRIGPTALAARSAHGALALEPIHATVNGGRADLVPVVEPLDGGGWLVRLGPGSGLRDAEIDDEVSHRVLAFVVPLLDRATRVHGAVSVDLSRAEIPIGARDRRADVEGHVVFQGVEFAPGPLAAALFDLIGAERVPTVRLDQPVVLDISDGRVHQHGLAIPLGTVARVEMDGSVGFDRTLDLRVRVPLAAERLQGVPVVGAIAGAVRPTIPIRGTLSEPRIDGEALKREMGRMGLDIADQAAGGGLDLLFKALQPRDPEEAARLRAEREERRRQKAEQRRWKRERRRRDREDDR